MSNKDLYINLMNAVEYVRETGDLVGALIEYDVSMFDIMEMLEEEEPEYDLSEFDIVIYEDEV